MAIGLQVNVYARVNMAGKDRPPRCCMQLMAFTGATQGTLLSNTILVMVVFWELTSNVPFLLIGLWYQGRAARTGVRTALLIAALAGIGSRGAIVAAGITPPPQTGTPPRTGTRDLGGLAQLILSQWRWRSPPSPRLRARRR